MDYFNIQKARQVYAAGQSVTAYLKSISPDDKKTSEIIETVYDIQAGSYIEGFEKNPAWESRYAATLYGYIKPHLQDGFTILDVGTGELTRLCELCNIIDIPLSKVFAFDISWSRIFHGMKFWNRHTKKNEIDLNIFVSDMTHIPLPGKSIDIVLSNHALEPNGQNLACILQEIFRVARHKCIFFEPCYELASETQKQRMVRLGYIKALKNEAEKLGGHVESITLLDNSINPDNPTACYVVCPASDTKPTHEHKPVLCVPGSDYHLTREGDFLLSAETGHAFPVLKNIPILKNEAGILATALF